MTVATDRASNKASQLNGSSGGCGIAVHAGKYSCAVYLTYNSSNSMKTSSLEVSKAHELQWLESELKCIESTLYTGMLNAMHARNKI